jgi:DNA adenine methylase
MPEYLGTYVARIMPAAARLASVSLECKPALEIIEGYGRHPKTLVYADPPYLGSLRRLTSHGRGRGPAYTHDLRSDQEHAELAEVLHECAAMVVLSGYDAPLYSHLYEDWYRAEIRTQAGNGGGDRARTEVLWSNRPFPATQPALFDLEAG